MCVWSTVRGSLVAGVALVAPLVVTLFTIQRLVGWLTALTGSVVQGTRLAQYTGNIEAVAQLLAVAVVPALLVGLGYLVDISVRRGVRRVTTGTEERQAEVAALVTDGERPA